ncbi:Superfamily II DNA or RNA helicase, SNF2 family [Chitinophaga sp. CF118]|uniref:DEAD/DEAH box helicase n=1 Tax=Chitinophaga sp. CF118 TaxID=1884367 RepID=UPI0008E2F46A|nr:DEAD/DEAH box helicase [Chitinophaga sp. CF118]SFD27126.1 Superfamily II DNA or RNA helicase, SNF2 family [Chitinophaga sp. CF118]
MINEAFYLRQHYQSKPEDTKLVIDVLSIHLYPLERHRLIDKVLQLRELPQSGIVEILQDLVDERMVVINLAGNYSLIPEYGFCMFPVNIVKPHYLRLLDEKSYSFYSTSARLQELHQLLIAYFTGEKSLLLQPVRKLEFELAEYFPYLCYLLYFPAYESLLRLFSEDSIIKIYAATIKYTMLEMPLLSDVYAFQKKIAAFIPVTEQTLTDPELLLLEGNFRETDHHYARAVTFLYNGETEKAYAAFEQGLKEQRQTDKKNSVPNSPLFSFLYALTLTLLPDVQSYPVINKITAAYEKKLFATITPAICLLHFHNGKKEKAENILQILLETNAKQPGRYLLSYLSIICLQLFHPKSKLLKTYSPIAKMILSRGIEHNYRLLTYEYLFLFKEDGYLGYESLFQEIAAFIGKKPALSLLQKLPDWERLLNTLLLSNENNVKKEKVVIESRLIYLIDFYNYSIQPVLQTNQGGEWSKGRSVELKKLKEGKVEGMTDQDFRIGATLRKETHYTYGGESFSFEEKVWEEITGHPYLFLKEQPTVAVEIIKGVPELFVNKTGKGFTFNSNISETIGDTVIVKETMNRLKIIKLTPQQRTLLNTLKQIDVVPAAGKDKLLQALRNIGAHITVHSNLDETATDIKQKAADSRIRVQLLPIGTALKAAFFVKPFANDPPYCKPGEGAKVIIGMMDGERCQAVRDLDTERGNLALLMVYIQQSIVQEVDDEVIIFEDPLDCLQLLDIIQRNPELAVAEWLEGEKFKIRKQVAGSNLRLTVRKANGRWFECNGELQADENTVLSLKELLDATRISKNRFIALKNGDFLALTNKLYKHLNELASIALTENDTIKVQQLSAHMLDELLESAGSVDADNDWKTHRSKWEEAAALEPEVPSTLQTTLRPYQEEGFRWMARLASWGAGACLADDMGLGKTIQGITMLLYRASLGPALVVCPASVLPNWTNEINRFAPSLRLVYLNTVNREDVLKAAIAFDVVITTYGILQSEEKLFAAVNWTTVVLDEAHIIKNFQTKTSKAAMSLQADFKLILTGTPIQNNLGEIWNLFNFINPGLLGTLYDFNKKFTTPVIYNPDSTVKKHLKKLISPFMLRRTKAGVLDELPAKTEIVRMVDLSPDEVAFYEALRLKAVENIKKYGNVNGRQHLNALTEIGKLRMAACNPQMIDEDVNIPSSKLSVFLEIVTELISNNHRALVFSQFVKHLDLVKKALDHMGISYLYLDGSTPIPMRDTLVKEFQSGKGDLFLISLKAGGLGLNLTAADYVIHMDPWWNPAVEEQASDRAHRIGQTKPVTIYRLVTKHTIEEKIIALHHNKRDLADQLLQGSDQAGRLSTEELMKLITAG